MSDASPSFPPLCAADPATFWPWLAWTDHARWPSPSTTTVVVPLTGLADWDLGWPLEAEEALALSLLQRATQQAPEHRGRVLVLPPLRFVVGPDARCAFPVSPELAHAAIEDLCRSVAASGYHRLVLYNSSPWNEELVDAAARDLRIDRGLQMFVVNLSALGLDLAPWRARDAAALQEAFVELNTSGVATPRLDRAAGVLSSLLVEIAARAPLPFHGDLPRVRP